jgi:hypothetical protein
MTKRSGYSHYSPALAEEMRKLAERLGATQAYAKFKARLFPCPKGSA